MFEALRLEDPEGLITLYPELLATGKIWSATLILDRFFKRIQSEQLKSAQQASRFLEACVRYAELSRKLWKVADPSNNVEILKLFGIRKLTEQEFTVEKNTMLYSVASDSRVATHRQTERGLIIPLFDLAPLIRKATEKRLRRMLHEQNGQCFIAKTLSTPCLQTATRGRCSQGAVSCPRDHVDIDKANAVWYNARLRLVLQQIQFLQAADFVLLKEERARMQRFVDNSLWPSSY